LNISLLELLQGQIDITSVPFSDRGSRLLVYQHVNKPSLYIKLAERLIRVEPGIESYLHRPPFIDDLCFIDEQGKMLDFKTVTSPEMLRFQSPIGDFCIVFQDLGTLSFGLPDHTAVGLRFRIRPTHWHQTDYGGELKHVRDVVYSMNNGKVIANQMQTDGDGIVVEFIVKSEQDSSITICIGELYLGTHALAGRTGSIVCQTLTNPIVKNMPTPGGSWQTIWWVLWDMLFMKP